MTEMKKNNAMNMDEMDKVAGGMLHDTPNDVLEPLQPKILKDVLPPQDTTKVPSPKLGEKDPTIIGDPTQGMIK
ncbi:hypothetical protein NZ47_01125 [Anaerovibrio lipolyticus]|uniref:Uncharacterized protein n=1 Tax=Anaerovibrio lipolyticus TaxID=82374 RepID=A0A0B2JXK7_9FIRM|nr:hypothetical protein [Anaerovibrio lipolyticus]KHM53050.1 hypothetical protein NZ47_01125 [Anaerovibrio lipolyticus]